MVKRFESGDIIAEIGRVEAQIPRKEQSRAENYAIGDRVRAVIKAVTKNAKGPQVILSRTDPALLVKLFEQEVPEIYDGTVMIRGAVREAGDRAKVAVFSRERDVDPVGACVGMRGTRVQAIIRELRGEKIDIVEWSEDSVTFVTKALSPARVQRVSIVDDEMRVMEVVVEDRQLSLAIGKKGQNVRLAAKLTGWKIDIKSEEDKRKEVELQLAGIDFGSGAEESRPLALPDIHVELVEQLKVAGYDTVEKILEAGAEKLGEMPGFDAETVQAILAVAEREHAKHVAEAADAAEAAARAAAEAAESGEGAESNDAATSDVADAVSNEPAVSDAGEAAESNGTPESEQ
jgi:N utilization substance protein A